ncbi:glycosyltransferase family 2 protein [Alkalibacterium sp. f15]|uniref:glycosyltransferase family 2 protein n=1 Tax=Alkalibacterium sp. f15 TaxID=3414029 RepID=UPI003BF7FFBB
MTKISIIIPVYNLENYLKRTIDSIMEQSYDNWELIMVDDGSKDDSLAIIKEYSAKHSNIRFISQSNAGPGLARQKGLDVAEGEYILFVDGDDLLPQNTLEKYVDIIKTHSPDVVSGGFLELRRDKNMSKIKRIPTLEGYYSENEFRKNFSDFESVNIKSLCFRIYKKDFIHKNNISFSNHYMGEDAIFNFKTYAVLSDIYITKDIVYIYDRTREDSAVNTYFENRFDNEKEVIDEYKHMFISWEMEEEFKKNIAKLYFNAMIIELRNLYIRGNVKKETKKDVSKKIFNDTDVMKSVDLLELSDVRTKVEKILLFLLKYNLNKTVTSVMNIYARLRYRK